ncbi:MAG: hypothetical protein HONBIEJF_02453 [Fimbriimonadaceae bacterium]|nr:hypothetical protein [Fimbriimonadaceae bacterium]
MKNNIHVAFRTHEAASRAVGALLDHGVDAHDISVYVKNMPQAWEQPSTTGTEVESKATEGITVTTAADAVEGATKGAGIGLGIGVLAALASVMVPGVGFVLGGAALGTAVGGAVATTAAGAIAGGAYGYLKDQGIDEEAARYLSNHLETGGVLVSVSGPSNNVSIDTIQKVLTKYTEQQYAVADIREGDERPAEEAMNPQIFVTPQRPV